MSFDLLDVPEGYETDLALVIAPYFDLAFAKRLVEEMAPNRVRFVIDDGARAEDIDALLKGCGGANVKVGLAAATGIAHLKGFYFEYVRSEGVQRRKRRFLFGSANATNAAFCGSVNAELIADVDLTAGGDADLLDYLQAVVAAVEGEGDGDEWIGDAEFGPLHNSPVLRMPAFRIKRPNERPGFDSWLQRGVLAAKYRDAQQFLNVTVRLSNPLPKGAVAEIFAGHGLMEVGARTAVKYPYLGGTGADDGDDEVATNWRAQYGVWTHLGEWLSDECYRALGNTMQTKSSAARAAKVKELLARANDSKWKTQQQALFLDNLAAAWRQLSAAGFNPADYLPSVNGSEPDVAVLAKRFDDKVEADIVQAADRNFCARYVNGYEFPPTPRFRQDVDAWDRFTLSWGVSISVEADKSRRLSRVAKAVDTAFQALGLKLRDMEAADIVSTLQERWEETASISGQETTVGAFVSRYFAE
ncbi:MAG TPA: hypothetical protein VK196_02730 [Magnetospirillum sp.]|nr:hypothetical protein [Magnetospirillum sp.]